MTGRFWHDDESWFAEYDEAFLDGLQLVDPAIDLAEVKPCPSGIYAADDQADTLLDKPGDQPS